MKWLGNVDYENVVLNNIPGDIETFNIDMNGALHPITGFIYAYDNTKTSNTRYNIIRNVRNRVTKYKPK